LEFWIYWAGLMRAGGSAAWAEYADGKAEAVIYKPSGNANTVCVSNDALSGIENANDHAALNVCGEATCPCWISETLENLPRENQQLNTSYPHCDDTYDSTVVTSLDFMVAGGTGPNYLRVSNFADYYLGEDSVPAHSSKTWR
jgi:hypothetical protein